MKALGFDCVHFLPLAADPGVFRPLPAAGPPAVEVSFVGNSMSRKIKKKMDQLGLKDDHRPFIEELGRCYGRSRIRNVGPILDRPPYRNHPLVQRMQNGKRVDFEALIMYQATLFHRLEHIQKLKPFRPVIRGDEGWHSLLNEAYAVGPELMYYQNLNSFYNLSKINFNVTSTQMRNAVNQRVFDVPAAGRFLITDYKEQLGCFFEIGREMVCYRHKEEIADLVRFYLAHEAERERIAALGRRHVLAEHTYAHRVREMCEIMRKQYQ
jgi:spore maturation protein CgeB